MSALTIGIGRLSQLQENQSAPRYPVAAWAEAFERQQLWQLCAEAAAASPGPNAARLWNELKTRFNKDPEVQQWMRSFAPPLPPRPEAAAAAAAAAADAAAAVAAAEAVLRDPVAAKAAAAKAAAFRARFDARYQRNAHAFQGHGATREHRNKEIQAYKAAKAAEAEAEAAEDAAAEAQAAQGQHGMLFIVEHWFAFKRAARRWRSRRQRDRDALLSAGVAAAAAAAAVAAEAAAAGSAATAMRQGAAVTYPPGLGYPPGALRLRGGSPRGSYGNAVAAWAAAAGTTRAARAAAGEAAVAAVAEAPAVVATAAAPAAAMVATVPRSVLWRQQAAAGDEAG